jgi:PEP-CTERM motif
MSQFINLAFKKVALALILCINITNVAMATNVTVDIGTNQSNSGHWTFSNGMNYINTVNPFSFINSFTNNIWVTGPGYVNTGIDGYWTASMNFNVSNLDTTQPSSIDINSFSVDDRAELLINGTLIDAVGIYGGVGTTGGLFQSAAGGSYKPTSFNDNKSGLHEVLLSTLLHNGVNTIEVIVNNTGHGIWGSTISTGIYNPTAFALDATITYDPPAIPEPSSIALLTTGLLGFGVLRRRKHQA